MKKSIFAVLNSHDGCGRYCGKILNVPEVTRVGHVDDDWLVTLLQLLREDRKFACERIMK